MLNIIEKKPKVIAHQGKKATEIKVHTSAVQYCTILYF